MAKKQIKNDNDDFEIIVKLVVKELKKEQELQKNKNIIDKIFNPTITVNKISYYDKITFGKYKGKLIKDIIEEDYQYIKWCISKNIFNVDDIAKEKIDEKEKYKNICFYSHGMDSDYIDELGSCYGLDGGAQGW